MEGGDIYQAAGRYRFALCWAMQPPYARELMFSKEAENGFSGRVLFSVCDADEDTEPQNIPTPSLDALLDVIRVVRRRQDVDAIYRQELPHTPKTLTPTPEAYEQIRAYNRLARASREGTSEHAQAFWKRAAENATRVAAVFRAYRLYTGETADARWDTGDLRQAMEVVNWAGAQLDANAGMGEISDWADAANAYAKALPEAVRWAPAKGRKPDGLTVALKQWMVQKRTPGTERVRNNPQARTWIAEQLQEHNYVRPIDKHGRVAVHPDLLQ